MNRKPSAQDPVRVIVVPVDFSHASMAGIARAAEMARQHDARIILLHVLQHHEGADDPTLSASWNSDEERIQRIQERLRELAHRELGAGVRSHVVVTRHRNIETAIADFARSVKADLIITGTHGTDLARHPMLVSLSDEIGQRAECPVISVTPGRPKSPVT